jgi:hypothetical protein
MTWTICIATLGQRREHLRRLLDVLMPQVDAAEGVNVLTYFDNGETDLAVKRQALLDAVTSDYVCFVDDDDLVSDDYVTSILAAMTSGPDYVGFEVGVWKNGRRYGLSDHSLRHGAWSRDGDVYLRDITHLNPMRTTIAKTGDFTLTGRGGAEDRAWVDQIRAGGLLQTEVVIDRVLYHYLWVPDGSAWKRPDDRITAADRAGRAWRPLAVASPNFAYHPDSKLPPGDTGAEILIIVPARTRVENITRLADAFTATGAWGTADLRVDIDADDPRYRDYLKLDLPAGARYAVGHRWRSSMWKLNRAARQESSSYYALGFFGDDHVPETVGWAQRFYETLRELRSGIVYANDGLRGEGLPTQWVMTADIVRVLDNRLSVAPVTHLYCDNAVKDLGEAAECIRYLPDVMIRHRHYVAGLAPKDEQYARVNSREQFTKDKALYEAWRRDQLPVDVAAVRALR